VDLARVAARGGVVAELLGGDGLAGLDDETDGDTDGDTDDETEGETDCATTAPDLPEHAVAPVVTVTSSAATITTTLERARRGLWLTRWRRTWLR
jgi:hypothetical protein